MQVAGTLIDRLSVARRLLSRACSSPDTRRDNVVDKTGRLKKKRLFSYWLLLITTYSSEQALARLDEQQLITSCLHNQIVSLDNRKPYALSMTPTQPLLRCADMRGQDELHRAERYLRTRHLSGEELWPLSDFVVELHPNFFETFSLSTFLLATSDGDTKATLMKSDCRWS